ncbi:MAG: glycosyltransferase family 2 protein [Thiohalomonadales bacterium]
MESKSTLISIVMNCYNSDRYLKQAIDSIYSQTFSGWEIIFWDNASTDSSSEIAQTYDSRLKYFRADKTSPLGEARIRAMKEAKAKYIAFLDCDDLYLPDKIEKQIYLMEKGNYNMSYGGAIAIDQEGHEIKKLPVVYNSGYVFEELLKRYEINMQSVMIRRATLEKDGLSFQSNLHYCPDHNLFMELASRYPVGIIKDYIVKYRISSDSLSRKTHHLVSNEIKYTLDAIFERSPELTKKYKKAVNGAYSKLHFYEAVSSIYQNNYKKARQSLKIILVKRWEYAVLYILLFLPIPNSFILKLLNR